MRPGGFEELIPGTWNIALSPVAAYRLLSLPVFGRRLDVPHITRLIQRQS